MEGFPYKSYKGKKDFIMKKLIVLGAAVLMLLLGFVASVNVEGKEQGVKVCEDLEPKPDPHDSIVRG